MRLITQLLARSTQVSQYFITTPIFYVNAEPHIGHVHTLVLADALHKFNLLKGANETVFSTGTDEHGLKIQRAAQSKGYQTQEFCDNISKRFKELCVTFDIGNTHFVRTSDDNHKKAVQSFWDKLKKSDYIYQSKYAGWYSVADETFVPSSAIEEKEMDGNKIKVSSETGHVLEWYEENNYMFKLSEFAEPLLKKLDSGNFTIKPDKFHDLVKHMIKQGLNDLSVSRPASRLSWGIPVPEDESHRVYVWLDALVNYLTVVGYPDRMNLWPPDCHVIGKDIIKFHGIYWPAFLMAADLEVPKRIICHSHWTVDGVKMSKSKGNMVDPLELLKIYAPESIRYFLLRQAVPHDDGNFCENQMKKFLNLELADTLGNLLSRCAAPKINLKQIYPTTPDPRTLDQLPIADLLKSLESLQLIVGKYFEEANFYDAIDQIMTTLRIANKLVQDCKPWSLAKNPDEEDKLYAVIYSAFEVLRVVGILMQPVIPKTSCKLLDKLNVPVNQRTWTDASPNFTDLHNCRELGKGDSILFTRIRE